MYVTINFSGWPSYPTRRIRQCIYPFNNSKHEPLQWRLCRVNLTVWSLLISALSHLVSLSWPSMALILTLLCEFHLPSVDFRAATVGRLSASWRMGWRGCWRDTQTEEETLFFLFCTLPLESRVCLDPVLGLGNEVARSGPPSLTSFCLLLLSAQLKFHVGKWGFGPGY